jgi:hypothetical protein
MQIKPWLRGETRNEVKMDRLHVGSSAPACSALRPTDDEIELEARQWAEEYATRCENTQVTRQAIFAAGARWARGVAQLGGRSKIDCH